MLGDLEACARVEQRNLLSNMTYHVAVQSGFNVLQIPNMIRERVHDWAL